MEAAFSSQKMIEKRRALLDRILAMDPGAKEFMRDRKKKRSPSPNYRAQSHRAAAKAATLIPFQLTDDVAQQRTQHGAPRAGLVGTDVAILWPKAW